MTFATGRDAMDALQAFLNEQLQTTYAAEFADCRRSARCVASDDLPPNSNEAAPMLQGPYAVLRVERDEGSRLFQIPDARDCTLRCEVKATELSGGQIKGSDKPDSVLTRALTSAINDNYAALRDMGFIASSCAAGTEQTRTVRGAAQENNDLLRISFTYLTP